MKKIFVPLCQVAAAFWYGFISSRRTDTFIRRNNFYMGRCCSCCSW